jgi:hypothetical protein
MVVLKAYSCFIDFNISIIISIYDISLVIHLVLFDFEHKLSDMRWFILDLVNLLFKVFFFF